VFNAKNKLDEVVIVDGRKTAVVWGRSPQQPEANGGSRTLVQFFSKNTRF